ncbi:MAG: hypothetical protein WCF95_00785 [bacterium]
MINPVKITGNVSQRLEQATEMLRIFYDKIGHERNGIKIEQLQKMADDTFQFTAKIKPLDNPKVAGYMSPEIKNGKFIGCEVALPKDEFLGCIKLHGDNFDTAFHEFAHGAQYKTDPRIAANRGTLNKLLTNKAAHSSDPNAITKMMALENKVWDLYNKIFYKVEMPTEKASEFVDKFAKGGQEKTAAIADRLKYVGEETNKILQEIPDNDLKIAFLKFIRNGLRTEDYAFTQGAGFTAQKNIDRQVQRLVEKDGKVNELLNLQSKNKNIYVAKIEEYFNQAGIAAKEKEVNSNIEWNNDIGYMFGEKIKFLNEKIARIIKIERKKMDAKAFFNS